MTNIHLDRKLIRLDRREGNVSGFIHLVRLEGYPYAINFGALGLFTKASFNRAGEEFAAWRLGFLRYMHEIYSSEWLKVFDCWFVSVKGFEWGDASVIGRAGCRAPG